MASTPVTPRPPRTPRPATTGGKMNQTPRSAGISAPRTPRSIFADMPATPANKGDWQRNENVIGRITGTFPHQRNIKRTRKHRIDAHKLASIAVPPPKSHHLGRQLVVRGGESGREERMIQSTEVNPPTCAQISTCPAPMRRPCGDGSTPTTRGIRGGPTARGSWTASWEWTRSPSARRSSRWPG